MNDSCLQCVRLKECSSGSASGPAEQVPGRISKELLPQSQAQISIPFSCFNVQVHYLAPFAD